MDNRYTIQNVIDYIENNLNAEISIDELLLMSEYSYTHFCRLFSLYVGLSPHKYITRRKLINAVYDMSKGISQIDIALTYGFETYAGFYKAFKREFNCSPSNFKKLHNGEKPYRINILQEEHIMISKTKIQKLLLNWGLHKETVANIYNINTGRQNENAYYIGENYVIKFTANLGSIKNNILITNKLYNAGLPVAEIVKTTDGFDYIQSGELYFILTKRISGCTLLCENIFNNEGIAFTIGESIAKLHNALKTIETNDYNEANILNDVQININRINKLININYDFIQEFSAVYNELPKQIIHRDINPSNMIFESERFKGFIDFDLTEINIRIFDICYCATAILSECFTNDKIDNNKWIDVFNKILNGYESISPLTIEEKQALPFVIYSIQIICIEYFSKFDKYKDLAKTNIDMLKWLFENLKL